VPLAIPPRSRGKMVHGDDGMGNTNPPPPKSRLAGVHAAQFIVEMVLAHPGEVTLAPVGPLTNIALAVRLEPRIVSLVKEVVIMGGAATVPGNASPVAEANIHNDPHAAAIVFSAGWPLTMVGLDVTMKTIMTKEYLADLSRAGNKATELIGRIAPFYQAFFDKTYGMGGGIHTHDPSAIACLIDRSLFRIERMPVFVETEGHCAGQTVPDRRRQWGDAATEIDVCLEVDSARLLAMYKERITK